MDTPHWPSVTAVGVAVLAIAALHGVVTVWVKAAIVRRVVKAEMAAAVKAVSRRLDASEVYLTAAEQHTALLGDWEQRRKEEHERRNRENVQMIQRLIRHELDKRLKAATETVVGEVAKVPEQTATLVADTAVKVAAEKLASDSHDGSTPPPQYKPPAGSS